MRPRHFETLGPVCPVCRAHGAVGSPLRIAHVAREEDSHILEGALHCSNPDCLREFPIIDGIPLIIGNLRQYVADNALAILARRDLGGFVESMLGDCCGPNSAFEQTRQQISSYAWDHYGDLDPNEASNDPRPGAVLRNLAIGLELAGAACGRSLAGPVLDAGCAVGRTTFALAERTEGLVLGVDLHFAMLRLASEALRTGTMRYSRRRAGLVYEPREFPVQLKNRETVDFWACDAAALPFPPATFALANSLNVLDCVPEPRQLLVSLGQALKPGGKAVVTCPYDWSPSATPLEAWLGGHSQRSKMAGSCEAVLRALLTPSSHPGSINTLKLIAEREALPWQVRLHDRSTMVYQAHLVVAERLPEANHE